MEFNEITTEEIISGMGAGWNLGNTMDARSSAKGTPLQQETAWNNPKTTPEMIRLLADTGFSTLRIPVTWEAFIGPAPYYELDKMMLDRVQEIVDYGIDAGLYVILNTHHEEWLFPSYENYDEGEAKLTAVWGQIAGRFGGYSEKLIFEGMNEPRMKGTNREWTGGNPEARDCINKWNDAFVKTIRAAEGHNDKRWLMLPTIAASSDENPVRDFVMPEGENLIVSIHAYKPHDFALNTNSDRAVFDPNNPEDTQEIDGVLERLNTYFISKGIPVVIGEMGCLNKDDNTQERVKWVNYYVGKAAELNIPCIWWDNGIRLSQTGGESFGIMDRRELTWWFPEIAESFVNASKR
ncbi:MAG: glycoside hydrolase family 5 protein [Oscillospiraceae bacterium]|nr:glycoside hydrolase family 5 protein [Oscillospiraceae bacterium]